MKWMLIAFVSTVLVGGRLAQAQVLFQNLDFESAELFYIYPSFPLIATSNALPGWAAFSGTSEGSAISYNSGGGFPYLPVELIGMGHGEISGNFSVLLGAYSSLYDPGSIIQTGLVPADAQSLLFKASMSTNGALAVLLDSQNLFYTALSSGTNYTMYGADVSAFAGQTASLKFFAALNRGAALLDDIQFSPEAIPEPSAVSLILAAGGILIWVRTRRRSA